MKTQVHTLRFGNAPWMDRCVPSLDDWCKRHNLELRVWDDTPRGYPAVKFCITDMLREFLDSDADRFVYVDADVFIHQQAPAPDFGPGFHASTDKWHAAHTDHWRQWCAEVCKSTHDLSGFEYYNAGVFACDQEAAELFLRQVKQPYHEFFQDQHQFNLWLSLARLSGMEFHELDPIWNRYGRDLQPSWFFHVWGSDKDRQLDWIATTKVLSLVPNGRITSIPASIYCDYSKWLTVRFIRNSGLGNRFFELAAGIAIAKRLDLPLTWIHEPTGYRSFGLEDFGIEELPFRNCQPICPTYGQGNRDITDRIAANVYCYRGHEAVIMSPFQCEEAFIEAKDEVRELFKVPPLKLDVPAGATPVSVQVRRGDYVTHPTLCVTNPHYFTTAMNMMRARVGVCQFYMVSDDPAWCQQTFGHLTDVTVMGDQTPYESLQTMAACDAHIISNSTFGWWGAWLNERGPVIVPDRWFNEKGKYGKWEPAPLRWLRCPTTQTESVKILDTPKHERAIVYPWNEVKARWHELRYSLRSVHENFADKDCPIYVLGSGRPGFLLLSDHRVKFLDSWSYKDALTRGTQLAEKVLWMNDDICILKPTTWEQSSIPLHLGPVGPDLYRQLDKGNPWHRGVQRILAHMQAVGITDQFIYSTHTPYVYEREKAIACFKEYGAFDKMPLEMCYFNSYVPAGEGVRITTERVQGPDFGEARYLNYTDAMLKDPLKQAIADRFPDFAPWELKRPF